jgi:hypothetical protein
VVEVNNNIFVGDCPPDVPTMTDSPHNIPCSEPAVLIFEELSKELGKPFATKQ